MNYYGDQFMGDKAMEASCCRICNDKRPRHDPHSDWNKLTSGERWNVLRVVKRVVKVGYMRRLLWQDGDVYAFPQGDGAVKWGIDSLRPNGGGMVQYRGLIVNASTMEVDMKAHQPRWSK